MYTRDKVKWRIKIAMPVTRGAVSDQSEIGADRAVMRDKCQKGKKNEVRFREGTHFPLDDVSDMCRNPVAFIS